MKILAFADMRTTTELPDVQPDIVLLLGDIPSKMVSRIDRKYSCTKLGVLGNHCHPDNFNDTSIINMHEQIKMIDGLVFAGYEGSPYYKERDFGQHTENECSHFIKKIGEQHIDVLLSHSNPAYGDMELDEAHRGFSSMNSLFFNKQVSHMFHGHLHDPFNRQVIDTKIYSVYQILYINI